MGGVASISKFSLESGLFWKSSWYELISESILISTNEGRSQLISPSPFTPTHLRRAKTRPFPCLMREE